MSFSLLTFYRSPNGFYLFHFQVANISLRDLDRRTARHSTIVLSQFRSDEWISQMPIQVAAEAITDRLIAQAIEIVVESKESMRKQEH